MSVTPDPKSGASANSATPANEFVCVAEFSRSHIFISRNMFSSLPLLKIALMGSVDFFLRSPLHSGNALNIISHISLYVNTDILKIRIIQAFFSSLKQSVNIRRSESSVIKTVSRTTVLIPYHSAMIGTYITVKSVFY